jgi:predicted nucleic acid-binding protein
LKILLDTDVLMDVALGRADFGPDSRALLEWCEHLPQTGVVAWHTVSNLFYLLRAARSDAFTRSFLANLLNFTAVVSGGTESVRHALHAPMRDFEDALQVAAAVAGQADYIITRNVPDYRGSIVPAMRPREFVIRFVQQQ